MNNETFEKLPPKLRLAFMMGTAAKFFGRETVEKYYRLVAPPIEDAFAHGPGMRGESSMPGDAADPSANYWGGVWQIHRAD
jgi:hypothetical protein